VFVRFSFGVSCVYLWLSCVYLGSCRFGLPVPQLDSTIGLKDPSLKRLIMCQESRENQKLKRTVHCIILHVSVEYGYFG